MRIGGGLRWMVVLLGLVAGSARAGERLLEGFKDLKGLRTTGQVTLVKGADAVTEGASALELAPDARVNISLPADASTSGWLKIDTFEVQPVPGQLRLDVRYRSLTGNVAPGKDTLAVPASLFRMQREREAEQSSWIEIRNTTRVSIVIDNVRLVDVEPPPAGVVRLDFGPRSQIVWPGFEAAESEGEKIAWSGRDRVNSYSMPFPDPLLGDFAGAHTHHHATESMTIDCPGGGMAWIWITHFDTGYSAPLEHQATLNGKVVSHGKLSPQQMLSSDGLLEGKDQPWTADWFNKTFVPRLVTKVEAPLNSGSNTLNLVDSQVAAIIIAPRNSVEASKAYVARLQADLERYRRQFVLSRQAPPRCSVPPSDQEQRTGVSVFVPPPEACFNPAYEPQAEHRAKELKLLGVAGTSTAAAVVAVPAKDAATLTATIETLTCAGKGAIGPSSCSVLALEALPVARNGLVYYQPYLPVRNFRTVTSGSVYWLYLLVNIPERAAAGNYRGNLQVAVGAGAPTPLPVSLDVVRLPPAPEAELKTLGVLSTGDPADILRSLTNVLPEPQKLKVTRDIFARLMAADFNAAMVRGPGLNYKQELDFGLLSRSAQSYPLTERPGVAIVNVGDLVNSLRGADVQPGTARYVNILRDVARAANDALAKVRVKDPVLYIGRPWREVEDTAKTAAGIRSLGARPAMGIRAQDLDRLPEDVRSELFRNLHMLLCEPDHKSTKAHADAFLKAGQNKVLGLTPSYPDPYAVGFYAWAVGAEAVYFNEIFSEGPQYNAFWFTGRSLLMLNAQGGFEPTLPLLLIHRGTEDYALARRCELLVKAADAKKIDASTLQKVLADIRAAADSDYPRFDPVSYAPVTVNQAKLIQWRTSLITEAGKLAAKLGS